LSEFILHKLRIQSGAPMNTSPQIVKLQVVFESVSSKDVPFQLLPDRDRLWGWGRIAVCTEIQVDAGTYNTIGTTVRVEVTVDPQRKAA
jgi:hypothetical protein